MLTNEEIEAAREQIGVGLTLFPDSRAHEDIAKAFVALEALCAQAHLTAEVAAEDNDGRT